MKEETAILENWDIPEETQVYRKPDLPTITTGQVNPNTISICSTCGAHSYLKNGKCVRCDYNYL